MTLKRTLALLLLIFATTSARKIVGGEDAEHGEFPWQVSLRRTSDGSHFCGASVYNENFIVTAAHCSVIWNSASEVMIRAGDLSQAEDDGTEQERLVTEIRVHEKYNPSTMVNDIAVWKLDQPLNLSSDFVSPVSMPSPKQESEGDCIVSGWGTLHSGASTLPDILQKVTVPIVSESTCKLEYPFMIVESMLCAGKRGKDSCQGDSGGPLICFKDEEGYLAGIVSWGRGCAGVYSPGVYTEVSYFVDWLEENTTE